MQAAGMLRGTRAIYLAVFLISFTGYAYSYPLQILPSIPGYIPVYIRHGDQPLEEINPALAEAFHEESSLAKNIRLDSSPDLTSINVEEDETFDENSKNAYPVHVRQVENSSSSRNEVNNKPTEKIPEAETPKLLTIYELRDDNDNRRRHREKSKRKPIKEPVIKLSPLTEDQQETLQKLTIQVDKQENAPNELHESNSNLFKLPIDLPNHQDAIQNFIPLLKVDQIIVNESTEQPSLPLIKDLSQIPSDKDTSESSTTDEEAKTEAPVKEQRPVDVLSNVPKLSPIALPEESTNREPVLREEMIESKQDAEMKDLTERSDDVTT